MYQPGGFRWEFRTFHSVLPLEKDETILVIYNHHYLAIPLKIGFHTRTRTKVFGQAAIIPAFLVAANEYFPVGGTNFGIIIPPGRTSTMQYMRTFDLAARLEAGISRPFGARWQYYGSFSAQHSFIPLNVPVNLQPVSAYNALLSFNLGIQYALRKN